MSGKIHAGRSGCKPAAASPAAVRPGMMLGLLATREGVDVVVLEKHADFLRDFRGDTIHPSTLDLIAPARASASQFLARPHAGAAPAPPATSSAT